MAIRKMALFFREGTTWECKASSGVEEQVLLNDISEELDHIRTTQGLGDATNPLFPRIRLGHPGNA